MYLRSACVTLALACLSFPVLAEPSATAKSHAPDPAEIRALLDQADMAWWREARFGLFIHWGLYAIPAGEWQGKRISGGGEWIMQQGRIPLDDYAALAPRFNPAAFDADAWARLAKEAGMRYLVITSKHHDGFALYPSAASSFNVADATPFKRDIIGEVAEAARRHGLRLGLYYSQCQDWFHPGGQRIIGKAWDHKQAGDFEAYLDSFAIPQLREILTRYGKIDVLWFDTPKGMNRSRAAQILRLVHELQPGIVVNDRLAGGFPGNIHTPEQEIPVIPKTGDWETCMTMNGTWGYKSYDNAWKSAPSLVHRLIDIVAKGGNYLLNIGPDADGRVPAPSVEALHEIGAWLAVHGEAIHGAVAGPFITSAPPAWGRVTQKLRSGSTARTLYFHVLRPATDSRYDIRLSNPLLRPRVLGAPEAKVEIERHAEGSTLRVAGAPAGPMPFVIAVETDAEPDVLPTVPPRPGADGSLTLGAWDSRLAGAKSRLGGDPFDPAILDWHGADASITWSLPALPVGDYQIELTYDVTSNRADLPFEITVGSSRIEQRSVATGGPGQWGNYKTHVLGRIALPEGASELVLRALPDAPPDTRAMHVRAVRLVPVTSTL